MSLHHVEFSYKLPEWGNMEIELEDALDYNEKEEISIQEIKEAYDDIEDIEISSIKVIK